MYFWYTTITYNVILSKLYMRWEMRLNLCIEQGQISVLVSGWSVQEGIWPLWLWAGGRRGAQDGGRRGAVQVRAQGGEDDGRQQDVTVDGEPLSQSVWSLKVTQLSLQNGNSWTAEDIAAKTRNLQKFNKFTSWRLIITMGYKMIYIYQLQLVLEMVSFNCDKIFSV